MEGWYTGWGNKNFKKKKKKKHVSDTARHRDKNPQISAWKAQVGDP
jgi:hypothetical protein